MSKSLSVITLAALVVASQAGDNPFWSNPLNWDIDGNWNNEDSPNMIDSGTYGSTLAKCKAHCIATASCKAAQYSETAKYGPNNCFIYSTHGPLVPVAAAIASFKLYKLMPGSWSGPMLRDIDGAGTPGFANKQTLQATLEACQALCVNTEGCQAAQFTAVAADYYGGFNCVLYNTPGIDRAQFKSFVIYKFNPKGCSASGLYGCCPDNVTPKVSAVDACDCGALYSQGCCVDGVTPKVWGEDCPAVTDVTPPVVVPPTRRRRSPYKAWWERRLNDFVTV